MKSAPIPESLSQRLKRLAQMRAEISGAQLQIINLHEIAATHGHSLSVRLFNRAFQFLRRRLTQSDTLIPCSDGFIIIFGEDEGQAAELSGLRLSAALNNFLRADPTLRIFGIDCKQLSLGVAEIDGFIHALGKSANATAVQGELNDQPELEPDYQIRFRPVRETKRNLFVSYFAEPVDAIGRPFQLQEKSSQLAMRRAYVALDLAVVQAGIAATERLIGSGGRVMVGLTVHCETLADQLRRHVVLQALRQIQRPLRRYMIVRLARVPVGFPRFSLDEQIRLLAQLHIRIALELSVDDPDTDILLHPGLLLFGYHVTPAMAALFRDPGHPLVAQLRHRSRRLHEAGKRLAVIADGAASVDPICRELDAEYVSALNHWPLESEPKSVHAPSQAAS